jgi:hypothetical protein
MRKSTFLWLALATFSGITLFHTSQKVHDGRVHLATLNAAVGKEEESLRLLHTEWGYLTQPARLEKLTKVYLKLAPMKGSQFARIEDIPLRPETHAETHEQTEKPDIAADVIAPKINKILKPEAPVAAASAPAAASIEQRSIGDVIKGLGSE